jgi:hypothetical protein
VQFVIVKTQRKTHKYRLKGFYEHSKNNKQHILFLLYFNNFENIFDLDSKYKLVSTTIQVCSRSYGYVFGYFQKNHSPCGRIGFFTDNRTYCLTDFASYNCKYGCEYAGINITVMLNLFQHLSYFGYWIDPEINSG